MTDRITVFTYENEGARDYVIEMLELDGYAEAKSEEAVETARYFYHDRKRGQILWCRWPDMEPN